MSDESSITAVFVYGTLKQGQCRAKYWPRAPQLVSAATIKGRLHDLGPYPALVPGVDTIAGELWQFDAGDMESTMRVLDHVEGYGQLGVDYYRRIVVECTRDDGEPFEAFSYEFANPEDIAETPIVEPGKNGCVSWSAKK